MRRNFYKYKLNLIAVTCKYYNATIYIRLIFDTKYTFELLNSQFSFLVWYQMLVLKLSGIQK